MAPDGARAEAKANWFRPVKSQRMVRHIHYELDQTEATMHFCCSSTATTVLVGLRTALIVVADTVMLIARINKGREIFAAASEGFVVLREQQR